MDAKEIVVINSDNVRVPEFDDNMFTARAKIADIHETVKEERYDATIVVVAYNKLDKTRDCINSVLKYTTGINYNLILVDNGSTDGTFKYFKSLEYDNKYMLRFTGNVELAGVWSFIDFSWYSQYIVFLNNDMVVTEHWLDNMLSAVKADEKIGMITPMSTNVSNLQAPDIAFTNMEDFQKKAAAFNKPNLTKQQERLRLITAAPLFTKDCLLAVGFPFDCGFIHDFGDDEIAFRVRHAGYKAALAGDVVIHHNHDVRNMENKDPVKFQKSLESGRENFKTKYFGVDAWDDVNNFVFQYIGNSVLEPAGKSDVKILGIDVRAGTPLLDIKNIIRKYGIFEPEISAFTRDAKYYTDLKTFCGGSIVCDRIEYLCNSFEAGSFDYIIIEKNANEYGDPSEIVTAASSLLKERGQMFFPIKNLFGVHNLLNMFFIGDAYFSEAVPITLEKLVGDLREAGLADVQLITAVNSPVDQNVLNWLRSLINTANANSDCAVKEETLSRLCADRYWLKVVK